MIIVLEEAVDLFFELLQIERNEVLLVEIEQFQSIIVNFCRKQLEIPFCRTLTTTTD